MARAKFLEQTDYQQSSIKCFGAIFHTLLLLRLTLLTRSVNYQSLKDEQLHKTYSQERIRPQKCLKLATGFISLNCDYK